jgi:hypothetical protein
MQEFLEESRRFLSHHHTKRWQARIIHELKEQTSSQRVLLQIDFAENYSCLHQDEAQSAHWHKSQVTLFTACFWTSPRPKSFAVVTDNLHHDKSSVAALLVQLLTHFFDGTPGCQFLHICSDGPSSQFKNRFIFALLSKVRQHFAIQSLCWSFFASAHGKGPCDGVGGLVKRKVRQAVISRRVMSVTNAKEFCDAFNQSSSGINLQLILSTEESETKALNDIGAMEIFDAAPSQPNISLDHFWRWNSNGIQRCRLTPDDVLPCEFIDLEADAAPAAGPVQIPLPHDRAILPGTVVKCTLFDSRQRSKSFVAAVIECEGDLVHVKYLRQFTRNVFIYPTIADESWESLENVSVINPQPTCDHRQHYIFPPECSL